MKTHRFPEEPYTTTMLVYKYGEHDIKIDAPYMLKLNHWTSSKWVQGPPTPGVVSNYQIDWIQFTPYKP